MRGIIDKQMFEQLFRKYYSRLYYYAYDYVEDVEVSKDIVSEVFSRVWNDRERMDVQTIQNYLFVSVRNQCLNHLKLEQHRSEFQDYYLQMGDDADDDDWELLEEQTRELCTEIEKMPARTQYILKECYYHQKKYKEVAEVLGISSDGIKKHIVKAFAQLREHFKVKKQ